MTTRTRRGRVRGRRWRAVIVAGSLLAPLVVTGCGDSGPAPPNGQSRTVQVRITGEQVDPPAQLVTVSLGTTVTVQATSDHYDQLHVHGYDIPATLRPHQTVSVTFVANRPGVFEVETHAAGHLKLFDLQVQ